MNIKEIMTKDVQVIQPDASIKDAAVKMDELDVGCLLVCDNDRLRGVITDRDIVVRSVCVGQDPNVAKVQDSMSSPIHYCFDDQSVQEVADEMEQKQIRRIAVLNRQKRLVGVVSLGDFAVKRTEIPKRKEAA